MNASAAVSHALVLRRQGPAQKVNGKKAGQQPQHDARHVEDRFALAHEGWSRSSALGVTPPANTAARALTTLTATTVPLAPWRRRSRRQAVARMVLQLRRHAPAGVSFRHVRRQEGFGQSDPERSEATQVPSHMQRSLQTLYGYWNELRAGRLAPQRLEIEPSRIAGILSETFMLERIDAGTLPIPPCRHAAVRAVRLGAARQELPRRLERRRTASCSRATWRRSASRARSPSQPGGQSATAAIGSSSRPSCCRSSMPATRSAASSAP